MNKPQIPVGSFKPAHPLPRYEFFTQDDRPGYVQVADVHLRQKVIEFCIEHANVVGLIYQNMHQRQPALADEFMYGHILGMTYALLHSDKYPKVQIVETSDGHKEIRMVDALTGETRQYDPGKVDGAAGLADEMLMKGTPVANERPC